MKSIVVMIFGDVFCSAALTMLHQAPVCEHPKPWLSLEKNAFLFAEFFHRETEKAEAVTASVEEGL